MLILLLCACLLCASYIILSCLGWSKYPDVEGALRCQRRAAADCTRMVPCRQSLTDTAKSLACGQSIDGQ